MKALFNPEPLLEKGVILVILFSLAHMVYPELLMVHKAYASDQAQEALVFQIKDPSVLQPQTQTQPQTQLTYEEITKTDPLVIALKDYLAAHKSPLEEYADKIVLEPQWQRALAISWVESNFCKRHADNNCSGIGVAPGHKLWRKYDTHLDWFKDMSRLMEKPLYKERLTTFKQMKGVYVQPGSMNWVNGAQKKYDELMQITEQAEAERVALANAHHPHLAVAALDIVKK